MNHLVDLFKLIELTRSQPQYGYALGGVKKNDLSSLAEHHYMVAFIAWRLAVTVKEKGADIDVGKVLEFALIHDLGELLGGDIAMPYAQANPKARELAKAFEAENHRYLSEYFGEGKDHFLKLSEEIMNAISDESLIAKVADYMEVTHYKFYLGALTKADVEMIGPKLLEKVEKMKDDVAREYLTSFIHEWVASWPGKTVGEIVSRLD